MFTVRPAPAPTPNFKATIDQSHIDKIMAKREPKPHQVPLENVSTSDTRSKESETPQIEEECKLVSSASSWAQPDYIADLFQPPAPVVAPPIKSLAKPLKSILKKSQPARACKQKREPSPVAIRKQRASPKKTQQPSPKKMHQPQAKFRIQAASPKKGKQVKIQEMLQGSAKVNMQINELISGLRKNSWSSSSIEELHELVKKMNNILRSQTPQEKLAHEGYVFQDLKKTRIKKNYYAIACSQKSCKYSAKFTADMESGKVEFTKAQLTLKHCLKHHGH